MRRVGEEVDMGFGWAGAGVGSTGKGCWSSTAVEEGSVIVGREV